MMATMLAWLIAADTNPLATVLAGLLGAALGVVSTVVAKLWDKPNVDAKTAVEGFDALAERLLASESLMRAQVDELARETRRLRVRIRILEAVLVERGIPLPPDDLAGE